MCIEVDNANGPCLEDIKVFRVWYKISQPQFWEMAFFKNNRILLAWYLGSLGEVKTPVMVRLTN